VALAGCSTRTTAPTGTGDISGFRLVAFASDRGNPGGQTSIYLWDVDANAFKEVPLLNSSIAPRHHPSLSSDGRFIAFQISSGGGSGDDIQLYDRKGPGFFDLSGLNTAANEGEPAFTGDGRMLCYTQGSGVTRRVRLFDGVNRVNVPLPGLDTTGVAYADYSPAPNFDGTLIAFVSTRGGGEHIHVYDRTRHLLLEGPKLRQALESGGNDIDPSFSSSGRFLTFASTRSGSGGNDLYLLEFVYTVGSSDTLLRDLTAANSGSDDRHPSVSDTGNTIVFQSNRASGYDLWMYDRVTSSMVPIDPALGLNSPGNDVEPSLKWPN
jgi:Tol biopolymer transport system component